MSSHVLRIAATIGTAVALATSGTGLAWSVHRDLQGPPVSSRGSDALSALAAMPSVVDVWSVAEGYERHGHFDVQSRHAQVTMSPRASAPELAAVLRRVGQSGAAVSVVTTGSTEVGIGPGEQGSPDALARLASPAIALRGACSARCRIETTDSEVTVTATTATTAQANGLAATLSSTPGLDPGTRVTVRSDPRGNRHTIYDGGVDMRLAEAPSPELLDAITRGTEKENHPVSLDLVSDGPHDQAEVPALVVVLPETAGHDDVGRATTLYQPIADEHGLTLTLLRATSQYGRPITMPVADDGATP